MNLGFATTDYQRASDVEIPDSFFNRMKTPIENLNNIFGSGILLGSTITLKAKPGVGKTTFALTLSELLHDSDYRVCYSTGEEDIRQLAYNCRRLQVKNLKIASKTKIEDIFEDMKSNDLMVIDSFQTLITTQELKPRAKDKYAIDTLIKQAKLVDCALLFIVQENVDGTIKGGTTLPYAVDVNIDISKGDDKQMRIIEVYKNRFGQATQYSAKMTENGYEFLGESQQTEDPKHKESKVSIKDVRKNIIMEFDEPPLITVNRVVEELDIGIQGAKILLTELEEEEKIIKYGRGLDAIWKFKK